MIKFYHLVSAQARSQKIITTRTVMRLGIASITTRE